MDVEFDELTKDQQEIVLFLDSKKRTCSLSDIKHSCKYVNADSVESVLENLYYQGIVDYSYATIILGSVLPFPIYRLTDKGKELLEWM